MEDMRHYTVDASTVEERMRLLHEVGKICDLLVAASLARSPGVVEELLAQRGYLVTITKEPDGCYLIVPKEG